MTDRSQPADEPDHAEGVALARALRAEGQAGIETRRVRDVAKARLFGRPLEGTRVDRYFVIGLLGSGAMGSVYAAYDPRLDRKIALKVLTAGDDDVGHEDTTPSDAHFDAVLAEAQALAQVRDPNVVHVYDTGVFRGQVFLAMELVEGQTLRAWLGRHPPRPWRETLDMLLQAGSGLAAVHAAALVHRDFKPDNVLVGDDGIARVVDFGLARADDASRSGGGPTPDGAPLTTGAGTPAYLAPERRYGEPADVRTDLYAFCVTLFEAFAGVRPTVSRDAAEKTTPALPAELPKWLTDAISRGLSEDPSARQATMDVLLRELRAGLQSDVARASARRWRRRGGALAGVAALVAGVAYGGRELSRRQRLAACERAGAAIEATWPGRHDAVVAGIEQSGVTFAASTIDKLTPGVTDWATAWREARARACTEATVTETLPAELATRAEGCLAVQHEQLRVLLDLWEAGDVAAIQRATISASQLTPPSTCLDEARLRRGAWPDEAQWDEVLALQERLAAAAATGWSGKLDEATAQTTDVLERARALQWNPLVASAELRLGLLDEERGHYEDAERHSHDAFFIARRAGADDLAAEAATRLAWLVGTQLARPNEGRLWAEHAEVLLDGMGTADPRLHAGRLRVLASIERTAGKHEASLQHYAQALAIEEDALGPEHPEVGSTLRGMAEVHQDRAEFDIAGELLSRALGIREAALGADHPDLATDLNNLAVNDLQTGQYDAAEPLLERAVALVEAARGPDHIRVSKYLANLGMIYEGRGQYDEARELEARALDIAERTLGPDHPEVGDRASNLAGTLLRLGEKDEAIALYERSLKLSEAALGPEHPRVAGAVVNLGLARQLAGRYDEAMDAYERGRAVLEKEYGAMHPGIASIYCNEGQVERDRGRPEAALPLFRRCVETYEGLDGKYPGTDSARFALARTIVAAGGDRQEALRIARDLATALEADPNADPDSMKQLRAWMAEQGETL